MLLLIVLVFELLLYYYGFFQFLDYYYYIIDCFSFCIINIILLIVLVFGYVVCGGDRVVCGFLFEIVEILQFFDFIDAVLGQRFFLYVDEVELRFR